LEFLCRNLEKATDQELLSLQKQMSDQADRIAQLYANPAAKFPVPRLPQLEVQCSGDILQVLRDDFSVCDKGMCSMKALAKYSCTQKANAPTRLCNIAKETFNTAFL